MSQKASSNNVYWIFGNSGAGKSTLAKQLQPALNAILLDGDDMRTVWTLGLSKADREEQNRRVAKLAHVFRSQGFNVIVSTICPYNQLRRQVSEICGPIWIYLPGGHVATKDYPFEEPDHFAITLDPIPNQTNANKVLAYIN